MFETTNQMIYHDIHPFSDTALWELPHAHHMELCSDELKAQASAFHLQNTSAIFPLGKRYANLPRPKHRLL